MFENFQENFRSADAKPTEFETPDHRSKSELPSMGDLKEKLDHIFVSAQQETSDVKSDVSTENPFEKRSSGIVILEDGTTVTLPEKSGAKSEVNGTDTHNNSDITQNEVKPARDLTEDEKNNLKEVPGWTDKQISKCSIDEDGVIHYKTDREDMEGKTGENGVRYERKTVDIHGIKVQGVFPVFESVCDVQLPEGLEKASNACQFKECNRQLKENIHNDPELKDSFNDEQLEEIEDGDTPSEYVWHHNEETGKMQLVKVEDHDRTQGGAAHTGGKALWGGSYSNHETSTSDESDVTAQPTADKEVE